MSFSGTNLDEGHAEHTRLTWFAEQFVAHHLGSGTFQLCSDKHAIPV